MEEQILSTELKIPFIMDFPSIGMDNGIHQYEYIEYLEDRGGREGNFQNYVNNLHIKIDGNNQLFYPSDAYLDLGYKIVRSDNSQAYTQGKIAIQNNALTVFERMRYLFNNKETIEEIRDPAVVLNANNLMEISDDYLRGLATREGIAIDRGDGGIPVIPLSQVITVNITQRVFGTLSGSAANPHLLVNTQTVNHAAGDVIKFFLGGEELVFTKNDEVITITARDDAAVASGLVYNGIADGDVISVYYKGGKIQLLTQNGLLLNFSANADPRIVCIDQDGAAAGITSFNYHQQEMVYNSSNKSIANSGFEQRRLKFISDKLRAPYTTNAEGRFWIPLKNIFNFLKRNQMLVGGVDQDFYFDINDMTKVLFRDSHVDADVNGKVELTNLSIWMPVVKLDIAQEAQIYSTLNSGITNTLYYTQYEYQTVGTASNRRVGNEIVDSSAKRVHKIIVFFQTQDKYDNTNQKFNRMTYDHLNLRELYIKVGQSKQYPTEKLELDYSNTKNSYQRAYHMYLNSCQNHIYSGLCEPAVSYEEFKELYPMYVFDLRNNQPPEIWGSDKLQIRVHWELENVAASNYYLHCIIEQEKEMVVSGVGDKLKFIK